MKQDPLTGFYADRLAVTERFIVERRGSVHDLHAVVGRRPFSYILHANEMRIPLVRGEKNFLIILAGIVFRLDVEEAELSGIQATAEL